MGRGRPRARTNERGALEDASRGSGATEREKEVQAGYTGLTG